VTGVQTCALPISGSGSIWTNSQGLTVGYWGADNELVVSNGGRIVASQLFWIGGDTGSSSNNSAVVDGDGSLLTMGQGFSIGIASSGNSLAVRHGGHVISGMGLPGFTALGNPNNHALVSDPGSKWQDGSSGLLLGANTGGSGNSLVISNQGQVVDLKAHVGFLGDNNSVRVVDGGVWQSDILSVGFRGSSNLVVVAGGTILATNLIIGVRTQSWDNVLELDSGSVIVTNSAGNAELEVRRCKLILNGGTLRVDRLVMTTPCAQFVRNGGILIAGSVVLDANLDADGDGLPNGYEQSHGLDPLNATDANADNDGDGQSNLQEYLAGTDPTNSTSAFRILSVMPTNNDVLVSWTAGGGRTNVVQSAPDLAGSYTNVSSNIILPGSVDVTTNYLDAGAVTNGAVRFYRVRLVP
jgi:T5SS/PEP-CTERM-associated repeat protein